MTLYIYMFDGKKLCMAEAETEEKQKTYVADSPLPFVFKRVIGKDEIGLVTKYPKCIILTERDRYKAVTEFIRYYRGLIEEEQKIIKKNEDAITKLYDSLEES